MGGHEHAQTLRAYKLEPRAVELDIPVDTRQTIAQLRCRREVQLAGQRHQRRSGSLHTSDERHATSSGSLQKLANTSAVHAQRVSTHGRHVKRERKKG